MISGDGKYIFIVQTDTLFRLVDDKFVQIEKVPTVGECKIGGYSIICKGKDDGQLILIQITNLEVPVVRNGVKSIGSKVRISPNNDLIG